MGCVGSLNGGATMISDSTTGWKQRADRYRRRSGFALSLRKGLHQCCVRVHHPNAIRVHQSMIPGCGDRPYLIVEPALLVEPLEELRVRLAAPEIHVRDLEVRPDCEEEPLTKHPLQAHRTVGRRRVVGLGTEEPSLQDTPTTSE